jgi:hypothetical protein
LEKIYRMVTKEEKSKIGKKSRIDGAKFELVVRLELEKKGWIVIKNPNNVIEETKLNEAQGIHLGNNAWIKRMEPETKKYFKQGKSKYNPFTKRLMMNSGGFPDFLCYRTMELTPIDENHYEIIGVECKTNGKLDKEEKEKVKWLLEKKIFSRILIASKEMNGKKQTIKYSGTEDV